MDLIGLLNNTIPEILKDASKAYKFVIVGGRAIQAYTHGDRSLDQDWDILVVGNSDQQASMVKYISNRLPGVIIEQHTGESTDPYDLRAKEWFKIYTSPIKAHIIDVFRTDDLEDHVKNINGINYADLGFLLRELTRSEENAKNMINNAIKITAEEINKLIISSFSKLDDTSIQLSVLGDLVNEAEEQMCDASLEPVVYEIEQAKKSLSRIAKERDLLFGYVLSGKATTEERHDICLVCKRMETQYNKWTKFKRECEALKC